MEGEGRYLSAAEAAARLGIARATLYAYVSRGLLRSQFAGENGRERRYDRDDIERLADRRAQRRDPERVAERALHWGMPVLDSGLTLIDDGRFYYRGRDALKLAESARLEEVAALLWTGDDRNADTLFGAPHETPAAVRTALEMLRPLAPIERMAAVLPIAAAYDVAAYDLRATAVAQAGARIIRLLACTLAETRDCPPPIAEMLAARWSGSAYDTGGAYDAGRLIEQALILCADHELNVSSFTARCAASAGAAPYAVVGAGLCALQGIRHGRQTEHIERLLQDAAYPQRAHAALARRLRLGETIPGFGHPIYPNGDPRGRAILNAVTAALPEHPAVMLAQAICDEVRKTLGDEPIVEFGLVTLARAASLPEGAALGLFALGRSIGWIAHAIEQYADSRTIRPRANYIGELPATTERPG